MAKPTPRTADERPHPPLNADEGNTGSNGRGQSGSNNSSDSSENRPKPWRTEGLPKQSPGDNDENKGTKWPSWRFWVVWAIILLLLYAVMSYWSARNAPPTVTYNEFITQITSGNVESIHATGDTIEGKLRSERPIPPNPDGTSTTEGTYTEFVTERPTWANDGLWELLEQHDVTVSATSLITTSSPLMTLLRAVLPWAILIAIYVWFIRRISRDGGLGGFGMKREVKPIEREKVRVNFSDVAGIDEVAAQVSEVVDFLKNPEKYARVGAKPPKGVLLEGAPGTGKTLLARATAGEADVPFYSASASEFIEMIVGVGAQRVRQLFDEARKTAPSIIFIDEIDAIGRSRASSRSMGGNDEREQTLNQILTEMDGFDGTEGIVVMAATNRSDVLDSALTRPGRFDRVITVSAPDLDGRVQILQVHTRKIPLGPDVDLRKVASVTPGMTGADLANLANEAAIIAARREDDFVHQADFTNALEKIQLGVARSVVMPQDEKERTAYHEAGHALLGMLQKGADPVRKVSIIPRGRALGVTLSTPDSDRYGYDEQYLRGRIVGALGGMAAEAAVYGVVTTGAESDLQVATNIARQMVGKWGMSKKVGPVRVLQDDIDPRMLGVAESTLADVDSEVRAIIAECHEKAINLLEENRDKLEAITRELLKKETLEETEVYAVAGIERPPNPAEVALNNLDLNSLPLPEWNPPAETGTPAATGTPAPAEQPGPSMPVGLPWGPPAEPSRPASVPDQSLPEVHENGDGSSPEPNSTNEPGGLPSEFNGSDHSGHNGAGQNPPDSYLPPSL